MTDKAISPLRQRMIEDMTARHFAEKVQTDYIRHVKNFVAFLGRSPDTATSEDLRLYQLGSTRSTRCRLGNSVAPFPPRREQRESPSACRRTRCGAVSPRICSNRTSISGSFRFCSKQR